MREWKFALTPVSWRKENQKELWAKSDRLASGEEELKLWATGEEGLEIIKALLGLRELVTNVNLPNRGQIPNLPLGAVVETNALFRRDAVQPVLAGELPRQIEGMVARHALNQEALLGAALRKDAKAALHVFMQDPLVSHLTPQDAEAMFRRMLANTADYLPGWTL